jgi:hypothetical protein
VQYQTTPCNIPDDCHLHPCNFNISLNDKYVQPIPCSCFYSVLAAVLMG